MCGFMAHRLGYGFDALFCRVTFAALCFYYFFLFLTKKVELKFAKNGYFIGMSVFVVVYLISIFWANNTVYLLNQTILKRFIQILIIAAILESIIEDFSDCKKYLKIYMWSCFYMIVMLFIKTPSSAWGSERVGIVLGLNSNNVGIRCAFAFLLSIYFACEKGRKNKLYLFFSALSLCVTLFSGSRKSFLIILIGMFVFFVGQVGGGRRLIRIAVALLVGVIVVSLVMRNETLYNILGKRLENAFNYFMKEDSVALEGSSEERGFYREYAFSMFLKRPIVGYGGNGFAAEMERISYSHVAYSHCNYLELLSTLGIIGCIAYCRLEAKLLFSFAKNNDKQDTQMYKFKWLLIAIVVSNLIIEYFMVSYYSVDTQVLLIIMFPMINIRSENNKIANESFIKL